LLPNDEIQPELIPVVRIGRLRADFEGFHSYSYCISFYNLILTPCLNLSALPVGALHSGPGLSNVALE